MDNKNVINMVVETAGQKMTAVATDETVDRHGETLDITKWDLRNYKKNPVLQAGHSYLPQATIGIAKNIRIDKDNKRLTFEPLFHDITETARNIAEMFKQGILKTFSVGFIMHFVRDKEGRIMRDEDGMPLIKNYELLEISAVPVPANPSAEVIQDSIDKAKNVDADQVKGIRTWLKGSLPERKSRPVAASLCHYASECAKYYREKDEISEDTLTIINNSIDELLALKEKATASSHADIKKGRDLMVLSDPAGKSALYYSRQKRIKALQQIAKHVNLILREEKRS